MNVLQHSGYGLVKSRSHFLHFGSWRLKLPQLKTYKLMKLLQGNFKILTQKLTLCSRHRRKPPRRSAESSSRLSLSMSECRYRNKILRDLFKKLINDNFLKQILMNFHLCFVPSLLEWCRNKQMIRRRSSWKLKPSEHYLTTFLS